MSTNIPNGIETSTVTATGAVTCATVATGARGVPAASLGISIPITLAIPTTLAVRGGSASDGVLVGSLTPAAVDYALLDDGGAYTDEATDINDAGASDVGLFPATETIDDGFLFGCDNKFCGVKVTVGTAGVVGGTAAATLTWEYYNGTVWGTIEASSFLDDSASFTAGTSTYFITFVPPADWAASTIDSQEAYWLRANVDVADITTTPLATQAWLLELGAACGTGVRMPMAGTINAAQCHATVASGSTADTVFLLVNVTQGTFDTVTWTKEVVADRDATVSLAVAAGDEVALMLLQEDGSTEFGGSSVILELYL